MHPSTWKGCSTEFGRCVAPAPMVSSHACGGCVYSYASWRFRLFLVAGCGGGGGSQAEKQHHAPQGHGPQLVLHPEGDSGVRGTATFKDVSEGVVVMLELRNLPKPNTLHLAHIHPGTCAQEEKEGEMHEEHHEHGDRIPPLAGEVELGGRRVEHNHLAQNLRREALLGRAQARQRPQGGQRLPAHPELRRPEAIGVTIVYQMVET